MNLQDLCEKDIFKFRDSDTSYSFLSIEESKITIQKLHGDKEIVIEKNGKFSNYFNADIELLVKYKNNATLINLLNQEKQDEDFLYPLKNDKYRMELIESVEWDNYEDFMVENVLFAQTYCIVSGVYDLDGEEDDPEEYEDIRDELEGVYSFVGNYALAMEDELLYMESKKGDDADWYMISQYFGTLAADTTDREFKEVFNETDYFDFDTFCQKNKMLSDMANTYIVTAENQAKLSEALTLRDISIGGIGIPAASNKNFTVKNYDLLLKVGLEFEKEDLIVHTDNAKDLIEHLNLNALKISDKTYQAAFKKDTQEKELSPCTLESKNTQKQSIRNKR